jgi:hypothetical protein
MLNTIQMARQDWLSPILPCQRSFRGKEIGFADFLPPDFFSTAVAASLPPLSKKCNNL